MSLEDWKRVFEWGGIVLLAGTVFAGAGALLINNRIGAIKDERLRQFDEDLTSAKTTLGQTNTEMAKEQARAATAERSLLELQEKVRARHLSKEQTEAITSALQRLQPHEVNISVVIGTWDGTTLGLELAAAINRATGWTAKVIGQEASGGELRGIALIMKDVALPPPGTFELQTALKAAGIVAPMRKNPAWGNATISVLIAPRE